MKKHFLSSMLARILSIIGLSVLFAPFSAFAFTQDCTGGTITHVGGHTIHTFTSSGTFDCSSAGSGTVRALVVGGGGDGMQDVDGGGGGAGGVVASSTVSIGATSYTITVGAGGAACSNVNGGDSSLGSLITAYGGGAHDNSGGSGAGGNANGGSYNPGGAGTSGQGNAGGSPGGDANGGGGGGGAGQVGGDGSPSGVAGNGGNGITSDISGTATYYGGGGGGGGSSSSGAGGQGGGGAGVTNGAGQDGTANTGGGGGGNGGNSYCGGAGGSGIMIINYVTPSNVTANKLAKFITTGDSIDLANSLFSDDGSNVTLTSGNLFLDPGAFVDAATNGTLNIGTGTTTTTMTFGRSGQNLIINSNVGIATSSPTSNLEVNGNIFAKFINLAAGGLGLDTLTSGLLSIGSTTANAIYIGHAGVTTSVFGTLSSATFSVGLTSTQNICNSTSSPSSCGSAPAGSVAMPTGGSTIVVDTSAVTANSQILVTEDASLGSRLGITCNTTTGRVYSISARTAGTSFTIKSSSNPTTNKACLSYWIIN